MTDLHWALAGIGAAFVGCVWAYNKWLERRHRKAAERIFAGKAPDALMGAAGAPAAAEDGRIEPVVRPQADFAATPEDGAGDDEAQAASEPPAALADPMIDCVGRLEAPALVAAPELWEAQRAMAQHLTRRLTWSAWEAASGTWRRITAHDAGRYRQFRAALQLADRRGAISAEELDTFAQGLQEVAGRCLAVAAHPDMAAVGEQAAALDGYCAGVDVQIAVHVIRKDGGDIHGPQVLAFVGEHNLTLGDDGRFRADGNAEPPYTVANFGSAVFVAEEMPGITTLGVSFWFDLPRAANGPERFDVMVAAARSLAAAVGGVLVDDQRRELTDAMLTGIRGKIAEVQAGMAAHEIPAGGERALRLFA